MELRFTTESPVECLCGEPAIRRTIDAGGRHVAYDTHVHAGHEEHFAALQRLADFHEQLIALEQELRGLSEDDRKVILELDAGETVIGRLMSFDMGSVIPQACERRSIITGEALLRSHGITEALKLEPTPLAGLGVEQLLEKFKAAAEPALHRIHLKKKSGDY